MQTYTCIRKMPHELKLTKKQFNAMVRDVHKDMMKGSGATDDTYAPPATIPDFSGPDLHFFCGLACLPQMHTLSSESLHAKA